MQWWRRLLWFAFWMQVRYQTLQVLWLRTADDICDRWWGCAILVQLSRDSCLSGWSSWLMGLLEQHYLQVEKIVIKEAPTTARVNIRNSLCCLIVWSSNRYGKTNICTERSVTLSNIKQNTKTNMTEELYALCWRWHVITVSHVLR